MTIIGHIPGDRKAEKEWQRYFMDYVVADPQGGTEIFRAEIEPEVRSLISVQGELFPQSPPRELDVAAPPRLSDVVEAAARTIGRIIPAAPQSAGLEFPRAPRIF